jgi:hypothetical protein
MFHVPDQGPLMDKHSGLQPLTVPEQPMLLAPLELISPSSSASSIPSEYSSPTSPHGGPFTQAHTLHRQYSLDECEHSHFSEPQTIDCDSPTDMVMHYPAYPWENDMWANGGSEMMLGEDFDLNSIPPIELGNAKFQDDLNQFDPSATMQEFGNDQYALPNEQYHPHDPHGQGSFDGLFFDDMMSGHGF